ncbi:MAG: hypothetical protein IT427_00350 [Pirellulales bacterium]|nr:hypothetical protein [Pirellulales bacterium]
MSDTRHSDALPNHWLLVLCLVGVDYFSTLAYLPSIAVEAAGAWAPLVAGFVVLVTFLLALPVYWYIAGRSQDGRGAIGMVEDLVPGWRGKFVVLVLLGFASTDFVITRSLSLADAAVHLIHNPHGQELLKHIPKPADEWFENIPLWTPLAGLLRRLVEPQIFTTLGLSVASFGVWQLFKRRAMKQTLVITAVAVCCYLVLTAVLILIVVAQLFRHPEIFSDWLGSMVRPESENAISNSGHWIWTAAKTVLWSFPQIALGLSGFEMIMTVAPKVRGDRNEPDAPESRARNTRKLMLVATPIMAVYLMGAVIVTTLAVPNSEFGPNGAAEHRALAYLAHGSPLSANLDDPIKLPLVGEWFGDLYDFSTVCILCLAGASVTLGLRNLLPHYLHRLGMEISWAGNVGVVVHVLNAVVLVITVVFHASPAAQQWAYATSVLMLLAGAGFAAAKDLLHSAIGKQAWRLRIVQTAGAGTFFLTMAGLTALINMSGMTIATAFVAAIIASSMVSRWFRSTELRFEGFDFTDDASRQRWNELCYNGPIVLVPHRPGITSLSERYRTLRQEYCLDPMVSIIFIEATLGDPSNFYHKPQMKIEREGDLEVIRLSRCVSISHVLAATCLELCRIGGVPPQVIFGWSHESPLAANLNFLLLGEGNIPWMVKELVRRSSSRGARQPRIHIG